MTTPSPDPQPETITIDPGEVLAELGQMTDVQVHLALAQERVARRTVQRQAVDTQREMQRELARLSNELEKARGGDHGEGPAAGS